MPDAQTPVGVEAVSPLISELCGLHSDMISLQQSEGVVFLPQLAEGQTFGSIASLILNAATVIDRQQRNHRSAEAALSRAIEDRDEARARAEAAEKEATALRDSADLLQAVEENCWTLECVEAPTGGGDADVAWRVISYHIGHPQEREEGYGKTPADALRAALTQGGTDGR